MIKLIAAILMLIDHSGIFLVPSGTPLYIILRMIGRLSMPMFAYCTARGFYYSEKKGTVPKYLRNLAIFSISSQIPFTLVPFVLANIWNFKELYAHCDFVLNIGFTWLFAVIILKSLTYIKNPLDKKSFYALFIIVVTIIFPFIVHVDYGVYGVLFPVLFYFFMFKTDSPLFCFLGSVLLYFVYLVIEGKPISGINDDQIISIFSVFILMLIKSSDSKVRLPRLFFYLFYPLHIGVLEFIRVFVLNGQIQF